MWLLCCLINYMKINEICIKNTQKHRNVAPAYFSGVISPGSFRRFLGRVEMRVAPEVVAGAVAGAMLAVSCGVGCGGGAVGGCTTGTAGGTMGNGMVTWPPPPPPPSRPAAPSPAVPTPPPPPPAPNEGLAIRPSNTPARSSRGSGTGLSGEVCLLLAALIIQARLGAKLNRVSACKVVCSTEKG